MRGEVNAFTHFRELIIRLRTVTRVKAVTRGSSTVVITLLLLGGLACTKPVIRGKVVDLFKKPVEGAEVSIPNTTFTVRTDGNGSYAVSYVPGQFTLQVRKDGYTSETLPWNVAEKAELPAADVVLYPVPEDAGVYLIGAGKLVPLPPAAIVKDVKQLSYWSARREYRFLPPKREAPSLAFNSEARFLQRAGSEPPKLFRGTPSSTARW